MTAQPPPAHPRAEDDDDRPASFGPGRLLILAYGVLALAVPVRLAAEVVAGEPVAGLAALASLAVAALYGVGTLAMAQNGPRARVVAWTVVTVALVAVVVGGAMDAATGQAPAAAVWSGFGASYAYAPLVLPVLALGYLARTRPGRA